MVEEEEAAKTSHPLIFIKHPLTVRGSPGDNSPAFPFARQMAPFSPTAEKKIKKERKEEEEEKNRNVRRVIAFDLVAS